MARYRKKPVEIEAELVTIELLAYKSIHHPIEFFPGGDVEYFASCAYVNTLEGRMEAKIGDWIITGVNGEKYPCKPDIFEKTYELVEGDSNG